MSDKKVKHGDTGVLADLVSSLQGHEETRLEKVDEFLFVEHWKEGEEPFSWRKQWETLPLELLSVDGKNQKIATETDDAHTPGTIVLPLHANCGSLNAKKSIRLIESGTAFLSSGLFHEFDVTINAIDENHRMGTIFHIDTNLAQYSDMQESVCISCTVPISWLDDIRRLAGDEDQTSTVELDFNIHCFLKEYDRFSPEHDLYKKYSLEKGGTGYAFLADYRVVQNGENTNS